MHSFKLFVTHASEIWIKSHGPNNTKFWAFWQQQKKKKKKLGFLKPFWQSVDAILEDVSVVETIV